MESFAFTHYPIRFNRKTRMVHLFRTNGTVVSVPWDRVFFTMGHMTQWNEWEVRGHVLKPDNDTIQETFALSFSTLSAMDADPACTEFSRTIMSGALGVHTPLHGGRSGSVQPGAVLHAC
jgi:hypothetical protein